MSTAVNSYDQVPYHSNPFRQSHPDRLATIATLFGLDPAPINQCRVLELGCAGGGNLIPMAEQYPESQFLGIDASARQIDDGREQITAAGLTNVRLIQQDILKFPMEKDAFDYIICHGVYSWVPDLVQKKILEICGGCLTPNGIAYISYNTNPGWRMRGMIRDIMQFRARAFEAPETKLQQARGLLEFLSNSIKGEESAYGMLLRTEVAAISRADDYYLLHEHLEDTNEPIYFHEFASRAESAGLQYLGEADYGVMAVENFPEHVQSMLQSVARDKIETEQYMDFLRNRAFRQTLLCREGVLPDRTPRLQQLLRTQVASSAAPESSDVSLHEEVKVTFRRGPSVLTTNNPIVKAAMLHLRSVWPRSVPFVELASIARAAVENRPTAVSIDVMSGVTQSLAQTLLRCFATGQVDLHVGQPTFETTVSEKPLASAFARRQAQRSNRITNRLHEIVVLEDFQRRLLSGLDGTRDQAALAGYVSESVRVGEMIVHSEGKRVTDPERIQEIVGGSLGEALESLSRMALLVG